MMPQPQFAITDAVAVVLWITIIALLAAAVLWSYINGDDPPDKCG